MNSMPSSLWQKCCGGREAVQYPASTFVVRRAMAEYIYLRIQMTVHIGTIGGASQSSPT